MSNGFKTKLQEITQTVKLGHSDDQQNLIENTHLPTTTTNRRSNKNKKRKEKMKRKDVLEMLKSVKEKKVKQKVNSFPKIQILAKNARGFLKGKNNSLTETLVESNQKQTLAEKKKNKFYVKLRQTLEDTKVRKPILSLRMKMMEKLKAARFRFLNEQIYKTDSKETQKIFNTDPDAFNAYHEGYRQQVRSWPLNPVDVIIKNIKKM